MNPETYRAATLRKNLDQHIQSDVDSIMPWSFGKKSIRTTKGDGATITHDKRQPPPFSACASAASSLAFDIGLVRLMSLRRIPLP